MKAPSASIGNLCVVDGSFFVSSTAVYPALTIIANVMRMGDHLAERLKETGVEDDWKFTRGRCPMRSLVSLKPSLSATRRDTSWR